MLGDSRLLAASINSRPREWLRSTEYIVITDHPGRERREPEAHRHHKHTSTPAALPPWELSASQERPSTSRVSYTEAATSCVSTRLVDLGSGSFVCGRNVTRNGGATSLPPSHIHVSCRQIRIGQTTDAATPVGIPLGPVYDLLGPADPATHSYLYTARAGEGLDRPGARPPYPLRDTRPPPWCTAESPPRAARCAGAVASRYVPVPTTWHPTPRGRADKPLTRPPVRRDQANLQPVRQSTPPVPRLQRRVRPRPPRREPGRQAPRPQAHHPATQGQRQRQRRQPGQEILQILPRLLLVFVVLLFFCILPRPLPNLPRRRLPHHNSHHLPQPAIPLHPAAPTPASRARAKPRPRPGPRPRARRRRVPRPLPHPAAHPSRVPRPLPLCRQLCPRPAPGRHARVLGLPPPAYAAARGYLTTNNNNNNTTRRERTAGWQGGGRRPIPPAARVQRLRAGVVGESVWT